MSYDKTTHPDILKAEKQGSPLGEPLNEEEYTCFLCNETFSVLIPHKVSGEIICSECLGLTKDQLLFYLVEERIENNTLKRIALK